MIKKQPGKKIGTKNNKERKNNFVESKQKKIISSKLNAHQMSHIQAFIIIYFITKFGVLRPLNTCTHTKNNKRKHNGEQISILGSMLFAIQFFVRWIWCVFHEVIHGGDENGISKRLHTAYKTTHATAAMFVHVFFSHMLIICKKI